MRHIIIFVVLIGLSFNSTAQIDKYKAAFLYRFCLMVKWPAEMESGDFKIGIIGETPVKKELEVFASSRKINGRKIVIQSFSGAEAIGKCNILFLSKNAKGAIAQLSSKAADKGTMILAESPGFAKKGAAINFLVSGGKLKFELNASTMEKAGLRASGELKGLAILVD